MTEMERLNKERLNTLDKHVSLVIQKIDDYIAESRAARAKTDEERKTYRADMDLLNKHIDEMERKIKRNVECFQKLTVVLVIENFVMSIALILAVVFK